MTEEEWMWACLENARKWQNKKEKALRRLCKWPLWKRLLFYKRFAKLRKHIQSCAESVAGYMSMVMAVQRSRKWRRRQQAKR